MSRDVATMDELAIEGCTLRVQVEGPDTGPALVLSHMLGTDLTLWDALVPELAKHFRVVRYDARGHGGSGLGDGPVTLDRLGRDVLAILDALGIERAHFCGLSMGGAVGLWLLANAPARVERAVIAGSAAKLGAPAEWNRRIAAVLADGMEQGVEQTIERWFSPAFAERAPERVEAIRSLVRATAPEGYAASCAALRDMDLREAVRGVVNPVLVLRGADDPAATAEDVAYLVEAMTNATATEVDSRHCAAIEDEATFTTAVVKFLTAKVTPRRTVSKAPKTQAKPSARRTGNRGLVAARRPVARTAPVSGKAVAKASASRKTAARAASPAPARRRAAAEPPRVAAPKAGNRKAVSPKAVAGKPARIAKAPDRTKAGAAKAASAAKGARAAPARRATVATRTPAARAKPATAAALRAAAKTKAAPGRTISGKAASSTASAKATKTNGKATKPAAAKAAVTKAAAAKATAAKPKASGAKSASATRAAPAKTKPTASRAAAPRRSPARGPAGSGRRKP